MFSIKESLFNLAPILSGLKLAEVETFRRPVDRLVKFIPSHLISIVENYTHVDADKIAKLIFGVTTSTILAKILRRQLIWILLHYKGYVTNPKGLSTKIWGACMKVLVYERPATYQYTNVLPKLPLPSVQETIETLKAIIKPMMIHNSGLERYTKFEKACEDFIHQTKKAQMLLYARSLYKESWLADLWENYAYLAGRSPLIPKSNFYCASNMHVKTTKSAAKAANAVYAYFKFLEKLKNQTLAPLIGMGILPVTMHTFKHFCVTRLPGKEIDSWINTETSKYVIVFIRGRIYKVDVFLKNQLSRPEILQKTFENLIEFDKNLAENRKQNHSIAVLTSLGRVEWHTIRAEILKQDSNLINTIENAALCLHFTDIIPKYSSNKDADDFYLGQFGGEIGNIWYDKSLNLIVSPNGVMNFNVEHSPAEATNFGIWAQDFLKNYEDYDVEGNAILRNGSDFVVPNLLPVHRLETKNIDQKYEAEMAKAKQILEKLRENFSTVVAITPYGKGFFKKLKITPDSAIQVILQRTFYKLKNKIPKVYQSGGIIMYRKSRTETIRTVNQASVDYCQNPSVENLRQAVKLIDNYKQKVVLGKGADRHLFALYCVGKYLGQKFDLFENFEEMWKMDDLSTSSTPIDNNFPMDIYPKSGGFAALLDTGFGISYFNVFEWTSGIAISCYKRYTDEQRQIETGNTAEKFLETVWETMVEMRQLFEPEYQINHNWNDLVLPSFLEK